MFFHPSYHFDAPSITYHYYLSILSIWRRLEYVIYDADHSQTLINGHLHYLTMSRGADLSYILVSFCRGLLFLLMATHRDTCISQFVMQPLHRESRLTQPLA